MTIEFEENNCSYGTKKIVIRDDQKLLKLFFGDNGDLYLDIFGNHSKGKNKTIYRFFFY